ncbi:hypothetical protein ACFZC6_11660 [Streptomyces ossamyceticus]|uniref:hypothetical protein n=1 Tax=Streptomyces ossamyceticus TaxID=249581 RepID=UPI0036EF4A4F
MDAAEGSASGFGGWASCLGRATGSASGFGSACGFGSGVGFGSDVGFGSFGVGSVAGFGSSKAGRAWCHGASALRAVGRPGRLAADGSPGASATGGRRLAEPPEAVRARRGVAGAAGGSSGADVDSAAA